MNLYAFVRNKPIDHWDILGNRESKSGKKLPEPDIPFPEKGKVKLSFATFSGPTFKNCGYHRWKIGFVLGPLGATAQKNGWVIQKIRYKKWQVYKCDGTKIKKPKGFFETFRIRKGDFGSIDLDDWGMNKRDCTWGRVEIVGTAKAYIGGNLPKDFGDHVINTLSYSGVSPNRIFFPRIRNSKTSNKIRRTLKMEWNCCKQKNMTGTKGSVSSSSW